MLISTNIDRTDEALNTKAPFQWQCPLAIGGVRLPLGGFVSIKIYVTEDITPPVKLHKITIKGDSGFIDFCDVDGTFVGRFHITNRTLGSLCSSFLRSQEGVIVGQLTYKPEIPLFFITQAKALGGTVTTDVQDFKLLPQCHVSNLRGVCKSITVGDVTTTDDVLLKFGRATRASLISGELEVGLIGAYIKPEAQDGIETLIVQEDGVEVDRADVRGNHLIVRAGVTSNLRVAKENRIIRLKGVLDDQ